MSSLSQSRTLGQTQTWFCLVKFKRQIRIRFRSILLSAQKTTQKTLKEKNTQKVQKSTQGLIWQLKKSCVALLSNYLRAQKSGFTLLSAFLNGLLFLVLFWALKKNTQGTSEPLWQIHVTTLTIQCYNCDSLCANSNVGWFCNKQSQSNSLAILYQQYSNNMATTWQQHATALQPHSNSTATAQQQYTTKATSPWNIEQQPACARRGCKNLYMTGSHQSSLKNRRNWLTYKARQWSDMGPKKYFQNQS